MRGHGAIAAALLGGLLPAGVYAEDRLDVTLGVTSDYVLRGISQTQGDPAIQADLRWQRDGTWFAGVWVTTLDPRPGPGPTSEYDLYAGTSWRLASDWQTRLLVVHYVFSNDTSARSWDYDELIGSVAYRDFVAATIAWSPNALGFEAGRANHRQAISYELTGHWPLHPRWIASAGAGYYDLQELFGTGYAFWNVGVTFDWSPWQMTLSRIGTSDRAGELYGDSYTDDRWTAGVTWQFGGAMR